MSELAPLKIDHHGPVATHNYRCPCCLARHAVLELDGGWFQPCWACQANGWRLLKLPRWLARWVK